MSSKKLQYFLYLLSIAGFICLQWYAKDASNESLKWMLKPVSIGVSMFTDLSFSFNTELGYIAENHVFTIEKSCAGINFFSIAFLIVVFSFLNHFPQPVYKLLAFGNFLILTFVITIIVNVCRIVIAVQLLTLGEKWSILASDKMHTIQGTIFYCTFLLLYYLGIHYFLKFQKNKISHSSDNA
ncbi:MAG: exosortase K [Chitinophagales bacterium]